ncbi:hypothetical protein PLESTB_000618400 [Pleodorina starrii]|uniref:Peptidase M11 gametolysin domain-containing protein n=1 Tax=Pleodorina starrii TaxID=330485 RepID=A0A9W6BHQ1_9CHLO|nr:hypothetical protein PLESTB_000618400 [Pleodorina starrii]
MFETCARREAAVLISNAAQDTAPGQLKKNQAVQGQLLYLTIHDGGEQWVLRNAADSSLLPLDKKIFKAPKKDKDGKEFQSGTKIGMTCDIDTDGVCAPSDGSDVTVLGSAPVALTTSGSTTITTTTTTGTTATTTATATAPINQRLLVMIMDYSICGFAPGLNESAIRSIFLGPTGNGAGGVAQKYTQCSYGKFNINATAFRVVTVPQNCSTTVTASCASWAISNGADTAAKAMLGATVFAGFTHYTYILPPGLASRCTWAGLATIGGNQTWLQTSSYGVNRWATVMQETLHNYGLWHSWRNGVEYEDYSTAMGRGDACPNAAETSRMGWATPASGGGAINTTVLTSAGVPRSYVLPASYITGNGNYLRVVPNWLPSYTNYQTAKNLYIDVRVAKLGDAALGTAYAPMVNIHEVNATMDNGLPTSYANSDRKIQVIGMIASLARVNLTAYNLVVYGGSWATTDNMRVHLCRFATSPSHCKDVVGL